MDDAYKNENKIGKESLEVLESCQAVLLALDSFFFNLESL
jgi:hypothetical protein